MTQALLAVAQRAQVYAGGEGEAGLAAAERALALDPTVVEAHGARIGALISARAYDEAQAAIDVALALLDLKDFETALDILEPVLAKFGKDRLAHAKADPDLDAVRDHPRFKAMIAAAEARLMHG